MKKLLIEFKKIEGDDVTNYNIFDSNLKAETIFNESDINDIFKSVIIRLCQTYKNVLEKIRAGYLIQL